MPQLGPLPWGLYIVYSIISLLTGFMFSGLVWSILGISFDKSMIFQKTGRW